MCCTESAVTELSQETVHACETIRGSGQLCHVVGGKIDVLYEMVIIFGVLFRSITTYW